MDKLIRLVKQIILLLWQFQVALEQTQHLKLMSRFLRDPKKVADLLRQNEAVLDRAGGRSELFSGSNSKALYGRAKGHKHSAETKHELTAQY